MGSTLFRNPWALSSALATLGLLQPQALGFLNRVYPSDSASNYYINLIVLLKRILSHDAKSLCSF